MAGRFYPDSPAALREQALRYVHEAEPGPATKPRAIIAPHAGYIYSGPVAGSAYRTLAPHRRAWDCVVIIGPSHHVGFEGIAAPSYEAFDTPLGPVAVDQRKIEQALSMKGVHRFDAAHDREHGLEVQLPFLQVMLDSFSIVPLVTGDGDAQQVADLLDALCGDPRTLLVISSDLSHYHDYDKAGDMDRATARAIENLTPSAIASDQACGRRAIQGLLLLAQSRGWRLTTLDLRNSGDTAGPRDRVVGYGAWVAG